MDLRNYVAHLTYAGLKEMVAIVQSGLKFDIVNFDIDIDIVNFDTNHMHISYR